MRDVLVVLAVAVVLVGLVLIPGWWVVVGCVLPFIIAGTWGSFCRRGRA